METLCIPDRFLIIVPHSDDEIILFGGLIQKATSLSKEIHVALVTNGDYEAANESEGIIRPRETIASLRYLGVPENNIYILGYADTGMPKQESFIWKLWNSGDNREVFKSHVGIHTYGPPEHPDFHRYKSGSSASYCRKSFEDDLQGLVEYIRPDTVFTTHPEDAHGDHAGLYHFVRKAAEKCDIYTAFCHSALGDMAWPDDSRKFTCPPDIQAEWAKCVTLSLEKEEIDRKRAALAIHKTALKPDAVVFLNSFVKANEVFFPVER